MIMTIGSGALPGEVDMSSPSIIGRLIDMVRRVVEPRNHVRDPRPRETYYNGSEEPDPIPPYRYARGQRATPAPPGPGIGC